MVEIHPTAIVERGAQLGEHVTVGAYAWIGPEVQLGDYTKVAHHGIVQGRTKLGAYCHVASFATLGAKPQDLKYQGEVTDLICGDHNDFREYTHISLGTAHGGGTTKIGNGNLFMAYVHVGHDNIIGNHNILSNGTSLGGHVIIGDRVIIGGLVGIHQWVRIGSWAMLAAGSILVRDVLPFLLVRGNHAGPIGIHVVGLQRGQFPPARIEGIRKMYKLVYRKNLSLEEAKIALEEDHNTSWQKEDKELFLEGILHSKRGLAR